MRWKWRRGEGGREGRKVGKQKRREREDRKRMIKRTLFNEGKRRRNTKTKKNEG